MLIVMLFLFSINSKLAFDGSVNPAVLLEIITYYFNCVVSKIQHWNWDHTTNKYRTI